MSTVPLVAHRCKEHEAVEPLNADATVLCLYVADRQPGYKPLTGAAAECGACLGEQIDAVYQQFLDALDVIADLLRAHAEIRIRNEAPASLILPPGARP